MSDNRRIKKHITRATKGIEELEKLALKYDQSMPLKIAHVQE